MNEFGSLDLEEMSVVWRIPNFASITLDRIFSKRFMCIRGSECVFECYPRGDAGVGEFVIIGISFTSDITISFQLALLNGKNQKWKATKVSTAYFKRNDCPCYFTIKREELLENSDLLHNGTLTLSLAVSTFDSINGYVEQNSRLVDVTNHLQTLCLSEEHSDVSIVVGEKVFPAHKCILVARSQVFQAMFSHNMKENKENKVFISDLKENTVEQMLLYIYTGNSPKINEIPEDLLMAADKYNLDKLKEICEHFMSKNLTIENTCKWYLIGCQHNLKILKLCAEEFAERHIQSVMNSAAYDEVAASHPDVMKKLIFSYVKKKEDLSLKRKVPVPSPMLITRVLSNDLA